MWQVFPRETAGSSPGPGGLIVRGWVAVAELAGASLLVGCGAVDAEPISLRGGAPSALSDGLVGYWKLDESSATQPVVDSSGAGVDGTPVNEPLPSVLVAPTKLRNSASRVFNGLDQYVELGNPVVLNFAGPISMAAWVKAASMPEACRVVFGHGFRLAPDGEVALRSGHGSCDAEDKPPSWQAGIFDGVDFFATTPVLEEDIGTWIHLTGTFDGNAWRLYRNAIEVSKLETVKGPFPFEASWSIGGRVPLNPAGETRVLDGSIDDVRLYDRALSAAEVMDLYNL
jgi:hypothetical protein